MVVIGVGCATPLFVYKYNSHNMSALDTLGTFFNWFYIITGIAVCVVATILILVSFARRMHYYGMENGSWIRTFFKLLKSHLLIFIPPLAYTICQLPYTIVSNRKKPEDTFYPCGISLAEFIVRVIIDTLTNTPYALTWLLFVYPSRV
jgi:hypothetical protein